MGWSLGRPVRRVVPRLCIGDLLQQSHCEDAVRDSYDDEPYDDSDPRPAKARVQISSTSAAASWAVAVMLIVITAIVAACCVGSVYIIRTS